MTEAHRIYTRGPEVVSELQKLPSYTIGCVNWEEFPYRPEVNFRIGYSDEDLAILFEVKEENIRAVTLEKVDATDPEQKYWVAEVIPFSILGLESTVRSSFRKYHLEDKTCIHRIVIGNEGFISIFFGHSLIFRTSAES